MSSTSSTSSNPDRKDFGVAATEIAATGTLATLATHVSAMGIGQVIVATVGTGAVTVSLPAVAGVAAAAYLGISIGKKIVKAINQPQSSPYLTPDNSFKH